MTIEILSLEPTEMSPAQQAVAIARNIKAYDVSVSYDGAEPETVRLVGSRTGAPGDVALIVYPGKQARRPAYGTTFDDPEETQFPVTQPERFGVRFNEEWITAFFTEETE